jgi:hypothetical protein
MGRLKPPTRLRRRDPAFEKQQPAKEAGCESIQAESLKF